MPSSPESQPIPTRNRSSAAGGANNSHAHHDIQSAFASSFRSSSPLAQEMLARDLAECSDEGEEIPIDSEAIEVRDEDEDDDGDLDGTLGPTLYRRPSGIAFGTTRPALGPGALDEPPVLTRSERTRSRDAERSLLRDNHLLPPKGYHAPRPKGSLAGQVSGLYRRLFSTKVPLPSGDEEAAATATAGPPRIVVDDVPDETAPLLGAPGGGSGGPRRRSSATPAGQQQQHHESLNEQWDAAVAAGQIKTTWQREAKTITVYSRSLIVTFLLQYSLNVTSIFAVGRLGTLELGAVSLATMTANITCYAPIQGLATSLDTLCAQAFGSGHKQLVGLQLQRMTYFLLVLLLPVAVVWLHAEPILASMIGQESAALAASYLRIVLVGTPAYAAFEGGKRFVQAQGLFHATTYVLLVAAPINVLLNWLFVWKFGFGFNGAPMAVAITQNLLPLLLFLYVWKVDGSQAWGGFRRAALKNWGPMVRLALPGMIMVVAEWFAFEILTLASGRMGVAFLAAQSVLVTVTSTTFQIPFPLSIAGSTRVANLIGAKLVDAAKTSAKVSVVGGALVGLFNVTLLVVFRYHIPLLFTRDKEVIELVARTLPVCAFMQLFDAMAAVSHGLLRGIGRQEFGGYANLVCYYLVALPISFGLGFGLDWKLTGLWIGVTLGLFIVSLAEYWFAWRVDWHQAAKEAEHRNASG
ncbi:ethionine resistance-conferring protein 1 [Chaetomidium leptoderma]|uniref:Ethionine resistance-conferring protein 1 n=1 Tax=Chaetomidium leptoderma TaxID=669021 RepID=A0AAN6ZZH6_9PEZI|nr:ethionine resistance-conferring protein 1 [Chaetomidium leptoderma]